MLYGSEMWCLRENEMAILRWNKRSMLRAMCGVMLMDGKNTKELRRILGLQDAVDKLAKPNAIWQYGHVLKRDEDDVLKVCWTSR